MTNYFGYIKYILRHKYFVFIECVKRAYKFDEPMLIWRGLAHDMSKFLPSEFIPYARHFFGPGRDIKYGRDKTGFYNPTDTTETEFYNAWMLHQKRNRHHWQWWCLPEHGGGLRTIKIPFTYLLEMVCDWYGAGRAQNNPDVLSWYRKNGRSMSLHKESREIIELVIHMPLEESTKLSLEESKNE